MKKIEAQLFLAVMALFLSFSTVQAAVALDVNAAPTAMEVVDKKDIDKKALKKQKRMKKLEKFAKKMEKKFQKRGIDFGDETEKWLWYAIIAFGLALLLSVLWVALTFTGTGFGYYFFRYIPWLLWVAGVGCLAYWLVLTFS